MKALVYTAPNEIALQDVPMPEIKHPTDAVVRVTAASICGSDIHLISGHLHVPTPIRLGHEFCGEVVEVGNAVTKFKPGDRVAVSCISSCGTCINCRRGLPYHCLSGDDAGCFGASPLLDGSQAEYCRIPFAENTMHMIPENLSYENVLFTGDILSTGYFGVKRAGVKPGDRILIVGAGPVGMCAAVTARLHTPAQIIIADTVQDRLDACIKNGIADLAVNVNETDLISTVMDETKGYGVDCAIEAIGQEATTVTCMRATRVGGNVSIIGVFSSPVTLPMDELWIRNLTIDTGFVPVTQMPELISLLENGKLSSDFLITHRAPLNDIVKGYDYFKNKKDGCIKWVVTPYIH
ncbi:MAG: alcohol dehydrogenase [Oscillospiraceae bacterium]|nr:alcohol dehydrogenase [Oscillospiraceae bacterium]